MKLWVDIFFLQFLRLCVAMTQAMGKRKSICCAVHCLDGADVDTFVDVRTQIYEERRATAVIARALFVFSINFFSHMTFYLPFNRDDTKSKKILSIYSFLLPRLSFCFASNRENDWLFVQHRWWLFGGIVPWIQVRHSEAIGLLEFGSMRNSWRFVTLHSTFLPFFPSSVTMAEITDFRWWALYFVLELIFLTKSAHTFPTIWENRHLCA